MRVQYTLPGYQPVAQMRPGAADSRSFQTKLQQAAKQAPLHWKRVLRLDQAPRTATSLDPPPKPESLEVRDVTSERTRLRELATRGLQSPDSAKLSSEDFARAGAMLTLLGEMQGFEDALMMERAAAGGS